MVRGQVKNNSCSSFPICFLGNITTESRALEQQSRPLLRCNLETCQSQIVIPQKSLKLSTLNEDMCQKTQEGLIKLLQVKRL
jgi:hypothetical protein